MKSEIGVDTVIKNWFLIDFTHNEEPMDKRVLWGIVVIDYKNRWIEGDYCCTSLVLHEYEGQVFHTKNSIYQAEGDGKRIVLPVEAVNAIRAGHSPDDWEVLVDLNRQFPDWK
ncbi:DUF6957 family protein [Marinobacter sp. F3R08]|uniref:DUF6957 family protein n=1 Tax=Marinobacter sp. F3R08 TaxID=2841559 RepID=UPI001C086F4E|nr:hypothetical protein [Marinobacter sp. F3R08]MBU2955815.1 hypothetical protein [Marinobacter sp. F3R08]